jgi:hypothetical protein
MFTSVVALVVTLVLGAQSAPAKSPHVVCETYAPNAERITITVCNGHVTDACDDSDHCTSDDAAR